MCQKKEGRFVSGCYFLPFFDVIGLGKFLVTQVLCIKAGTKATILFDQVPL